MEGTCEQNDYRRYPKTNFILSNKRAEINHMSSEEMGGKYETITDHLA
jgi:hypothetical protein